MRRAVRISRDIQDDLRICWVERLIRLRRFKERRAVYKSAHIARRVRRGYLEEERKRRCAAGWDVDRLFDVAIFVSRGYAAEPCPPETGMRPRTNIFVAGIAVAERRAEILGVLLPSRVRRPRFEAPVGQEVVFAFVPAAAGTHDQQGVIACRAAVSGNADEIVLAASNIDGELRTHIAIVVVTTKFRPIARVKHRQGRVITAAAQADCREPILRRQVREPHIQIVPIGARSDVRARGARRRAVQSNAFDHVGRGIAYVTALAGDGVRYE